ncbi:hypothetical protein [Rubritalea tangerina]|uniref:hypothetical protein n=1 Tax=Rubritalea tangerina TaxID=430798 RepID=UPI00361D2920
MTTGMVGMAAGEMLAAEWVEVTQKKSGKSLEVEVVSMNEKQLKFKTKAGKVFSVAPSSLTAASVERVRAQLAAKEKESAGVNEALNKVIGHRLFEGGSDLWDQQAGEVAARIKWPKESSTNQSSSFRYYTPSSYQFLNAHPYSATLYGGADGNTSHLSLVFANKGDYGSTAGSAENHFKKMHPDKKPPMSLEEAIKLDAELISEALTGVLGEAEKQYYGEKEDRRRVRRWDFGNHAFLLSEKDEEYVSVLVVPKKNADLEGKVAFVKDADLKKIVSQNVEKSDNGDVVIRNIPMVDQGPKGYCAPATFERAMRYMLVPADMYLLATSATNPGGGTNTMLLADSCKRIVRSKARRIKDLDLDKDLKMRRVKQYIDKGVPILWQMRSLESYNQLANKRTRERGSVDDYTAWATQLQEEADKVAPGMEHNESNHHICMIIGYNEQTNELAVSDSWGARYELRWVHIDVAKAVTSRGGFVIDL